MDLQCIKRGSFYTAPDIFRSWYCHHRDFHNVLFHKRKIIRSIPAEYHLSLFHLLRKHRKPLYLRGFYAFSQLTIYHIIYAHHLINCCNFLLFCRNVCSISTVYDRPKLLSSSSIVFLFFFLLADAYTSIVVPMSACPAIDCTDFILTSDSTSQLINVCRRL